MEITDLSKEHQLMYELIYGVKEENEINLLDYVTAIIEMEEFTARVVSNLKEAGIKIKEQLFIMTKDKQAWILKIKR
jgi:hypothetical protein